MTGVRRCTQRFCGLGSQALLHASFLLVASIFLPMGTLSAVEKEATPPFQNLEEWSVLSALLKAYGERIESIEIMDGESVLSINGSRIYYAGGRMLSEDHSKRFLDFVPIFYPYKLGPQRELMAASSFPLRRSSDFLDALVGSSEKEVRVSSSWVPFLGHKAFVHGMLAGPLRRVESKILESADSSRPVQQYVENIRLIFSMARRKVSGTANMSYHAYGLALDIIPKGYGGKHVYWRWSAVFEPEWGRIPLAKRWQPPQEVVEAFEENGFVWGGKWYHFDAVHFEYRPEIIYLAKK